MSYFYHLETYFQQRNFIPAAGVAKPYSEPVQTTSRNRRTAKPNRPPLPSTVQRAASAEDQQHPNSWASTHPNSVQGAIEPEDPNSSEISLCSSFGNILDSGALSYQEHRAGELINMHYSQPHAYALYDFETKVEGDLQFRAGDLLILEDVVDEAWYRGHSVRTGQVGIFPMNHVEVKLPLTSGLYIEAQPKPKIHPNFNSNDGRKTPITQFTPFATDTSTDDHKKTNGQLVPSDKLIFLPKRPSRVRVSSLRCKYNLLKPHDEQVDLFRGTSPVTQTMHASGLSRSQTQHGSFNPVFTLCTTSAPNETENQSHQEKPHTNHVPTSHTPSVITSIRPRSQTSVSQLAQHLEQRGVTMSRTKAIPPGGRSIFPSSISPKSGPPSTLIEQPKSFPDYMTPGSMGNRSRPPSAHMVPTPLAMIAREQNRILCKGKLAPTEAYPTSTSSDPALADSAATNGRHPSTLFKNSDRVVISTKSEIDLSRRQVPTESMIAEPLVAPVDPSSEPHSSNVFTTDIFKPKDVPSENQRSLAYSRYMAQLRATSSNSSNRPVLFQKPTHHNASQETLSVLKSREDTLVNERERNQEEHDTTSGQLQTKENDFNPSESPEIGDKVEEGNTPASTGAKNVLAKTKALLELKPGQATCITKMMEVLSSESPASTHSAHRTPVVHAVPELPDASSCLKAPSSTPNLDKKQTDNFKDAIFSSLKSKHTRPDQWLYVSYDFFGTESGDLTVHVSVYCTTGCLDPLPPPEHLDDFTIPERWLRCATWYGQVGQVPSTFVRRILDPEELDTLLQYRPRAQALYDFTPESKDDLPLQCGDILYLYESVDPNWYRGESASTGQQGIFPVPFVRVICPL
ncbi:hypothetical protein D915_004589 [Fasciola hepatica]|uniref:SH3 domain-containing protein n=1 Tax=Fasciola hepatica TaxID=6192 RepID=A0A4E0RBM7_FASHE|nr:hypothetical protein D915_004589 [Fasciola hepatica]